MKKCGLYLRVSTEEQAAICRYEKDYLKPRHIFTDNLVLFRTQSFCFKRGLFSSTLFSIKPFSISIFKSLLAVRSFI